MSWMENIRDHPLSASTIFAVRRAYAWVQENLWPVYSLSIVVSAVCMLGASQEKQILGDYLFGSNTSLREHREELVKDASNRLAKESADAIKQEVWSMPRAAFDKEMRKSATSVM